MAVTDDGTANGKLLGIVTSRDYRVSRMERMRLRLTEFMTPFDKLITAPADTTPQDCKRHHLGQQAQLSAAGRRRSGTLLYMVFRKDYDSHKENLNELLDEHKRYVVGAGINTRDYAERVPALVEAGARCALHRLLRGLHRVAEAAPSTGSATNYGDTVKVGAGNVVDREGFRFLAEAGADFIKVGIGGGSICITREQKGIGRGQATRCHRGRQGAATSISRRPASTSPSARTAASFTTITCTLALAMGADFLMLGRYFARFDESPTNKVQHQRQLHEGILGRGLATVPATGSATTWAATRSCPSRKALTPMFRTQAR